MTRSELPVGNQSFNRAVKWSMVMGIGNQLTNTAAAFVIAAILGPEAYGTVALATVFLLFVQLFLEQGLTTTIVQRDELTDRHLDAAFWTIMATAAVLFGGTLALAGWWADVNSAPELDDVLRAMSVIIVIEALTVVQQALLQRVLDFKRLALRSNVAAVMGGVVGVAAAFGGAGIWALVAQQLVTKVVALILLWIVGTWRPGFRFSRVAAFDLFGFSSRVFAGRLGTFTQSQLDSLIIGVSFGPLAVGLYRLALRITRTIVEAITKPVALSVLPALSRSQRDPVELDHTFRDGIRKSAGLVIPIAAGVAGISDVLLRLFGDEWSGAGPVLVVMAVLAGARSVSNVCAPALEATGRPGTRAKLTWGLALVNAIAFIFVATQVGGSGPARQALAMAAARTAPFTLLYMPLVVRLACRATGTVIRSVVNELLGILVAVPFIILASRISISVLDSHIGDLSLLLVAVLAGALVGLPLLIATSSFWRNLVNTAVRKVAGLGRAPSSARQTS